MKATMRWLFCTFCNKNCDMHLRDHRLKVYKCAKCGHDRRAL